MKLYALIALLLILCSASAFSEDFSLLDQSMEIDLTIATDMVLKATSHKAQANKVTVDIALYPREDYRQEVLTLESTPSGYKRDDGMRFAWSQPFVGSTFEPTIHSTVKTTNEPIRVTQKVKFPLKNLPDEIEEYLDETERIDFSTHAVKKKAQELAYGEDDLYHITFNIASWIKDNVDYSLETTTKEASLPASWVLENKKGVCDELTNLFIAMLRSLGIPAKFVSGVSYTDSTLFTEAWNAHGWAEVYFPGYGWVPFDITYGEYGFVDATHIKLKEGIDSDKTGTKFLWEGVDIDLTTKPVSLDTTVKKSSGTSQPLVSVFSEMEKRNVGFGSHNLLKTTIMNTEDYYVPVELFSSKTDEIEMLDGYRQYILLEPGEERILFWPLKIARDLDKQFTYTFKIRTNTVRNASDTAQFTAEDTGVVLSLDDVETLRREKEKEAEKVYSQDVSFDCSPEKTEYQIGETAHVTCEIHNVGTVPLREVDVCFNRECSKANFAIGEKKETQFTYETKEVGIQQVSIQAENRHISKFERVEIHVKGRPKIRISEFDCPGTVDYDEKFDILFLLDATEGALPKNVHIEVGDTKPYKVWDFDEIRKKEFILEMEGSLMRSPENALDLDVSYEDTFGSQYSEKKTCSITISDPSLWERFLLVMNKFSAMISA